MRHCIRSDEISLLNFSVRAAHVRAIKIVDGIPNLLPPYFFGDVAGVFFRVLYSVIVVVSAGANFPPYSLSSIECAPSEWRWSLKSEMNVCVAGKVLVDPDRNDTFDRISFVPVAAIGLPMDAFEKMIDFSGEDFWFARPSHTQS
ncbi:MULTISPECIES: hypothetical protein [unclassified Caulobacter]|uniref:hypothetical protein n=1 Tax=unclassified Caulobacter TaxID=2648921 RepID=UPI0011B1F53C|nr:MULTISPECIES: hypothetical protein [unclassified Caulobacter]